MFILAKANDWDRNARFPPVIFFATTSSTQKPLGDLSGLILTGLEIYKETFCIGKLVAKKVI